MSEDKPTTDETGKDPVKSSGKDAGDNSGKTAARGPVKKPTPAKKVSTTSARKAAPRKPSAQKKAPARKKPVATKASATKPAAKKEAETQGAAAQPAQASISEHKKETTAKTPTESTATGPTGDDTMSNQNHASQSHNSNSQLMDDLKSRDWPTIIKRAFLMFVFGVLGSVSMSLALFLAGVQVVFTIFAGEANPSLTGLIKQFANYIHDVLDYLSFASEETPFPFDRKWPDAD